MNVYELNIDGLVGQTHHYAGLSLGNIASTNNARTMANPQEAALQGIKKMRLLHNLGLKQAVFPPHQRPNLHLLYQLGFNGNPINQITTAFKKSPILLSAAYSASSMWAANAATVSSSTDTKDKRVHFTAANLLSNLHRHQEADFSALLLAKIFKDDKYFYHHDLLPKTTITCDEGAANHSRLCEDYSKSGINLFVYGKSLNKINNQTADSYPRRQTLEASEAIARSHQLKESNVIFACQNPKAIDEGVFHNDVIALANESVLLIHEEAFVNQAAILKNLREKANYPLQIIEINSQQMSLKEAVSSYFFNSQLITLPKSSNAEMILISPSECQENYKIKAIIDRIIADTTNPIIDVQYIDLKQSMRNGGGPACLRLRVPLNEHELAALHQGVLVNEKLLHDLEVFVTKNYRQELAIDDLLDPLLITESFSALDELTKLLKLGSIYPFQREN